MILFDTLKLQNNTHHGGRKPIVAEVGVIVDNIPSDIPPENEGGEWLDADLPVRVTPGYYYVAMISTQKQTGLVSMEDWGKKYFVSKESIYEYIYGYANEDDPPEYIECYDRISDAADSDFLSVFLLMNKLISESRKDRAWINELRRTTMLEAPIETTIQVDSAEKFLVVSKSAICETPYQELRFEIVFDEDQGLGKAFSDGIRIDIVPSRYFKKCDEYDNVEENYPSLDECGDSIYFSEFVTLAKATEERVSSYFDEEAESLAQRFTKDEIQSLKVGILGRALGIKDYL